MTSSTPPEEPEFRGKTLTPVSPRPVHFPDAGIPVLANQIDPVFNDTSTHLQPSGRPTHAVMEDAQPDLFGAAPDAEFTNSAFEDAIESEHDRDGNGIGAANAGQGEGDGNDDYAMSLGFEDEDNEESTSTAPNGIAANHAGSDQPFADDATLTAALPSEAPATQDYPSSTRFEGLAHLTASSLPLNFATIANTNTNGDAGVTEDPEADSSNFLENLPIQPNLGGPTGHVLGGVDLQALLDNLSPAIDAGPPAAAPPAEGLTAATTTGPGEVNANNLNAATPGSTQSPLVGLAPPANLPPRPPPQEKPASHLGYLPQDDIRSYHPHNQTPGGAQNYSAQQPNSYRPSQSLPSTVVAAGAPGTASQPAASGLPPPPVATFQQPPPSAAQAQPSPITPNQRRDKNDRKVAKSVASADDEDDSEPWGPEVQKIYDEFLHNERVYVTEGQWDRFPMNSRLFIGNLPTEKVTKRDLFHIFHKHGKLAQVSIKQAYGFVQFLDAPSCLRALQIEQGQTILKYRNPKRTRAMQGQIRQVVPQAAVGLVRQTAVSERPRRAAVNSILLADPGEIEPIGPLTTDLAVIVNFAKGAGCEMAIDPLGHRLHGEAVMITGVLATETEAVTDMTGGAARGHLTAVTAGIGAVALELEIWRKNQTCRYLAVILEMFRNELDRYDHFGFKCLNETTISNGGANEQCLAYRNFVTFVEKAFRDRGVQTDVLFLNARLSIDAVIRRQILEGVLAVARLTRPGQMSAKISLQVFDRSSGADNVRFNEYEGLEPHIAAELVIRAKQSYAPPNPTPYAATQPYQAPQAPQYGSTYGGLNQQPLQQPAPGANAAAPNIANLITSLDGPTLQKLLGALQQQSPQTPQTPQQVSTSLTPDLASLLSGAGRQQPQQQQQQPQPQYHQPQANNPYAALASTPALASANPALASLLAGAANRQQAPPVQQPAQPAQPTQQVQNIMEQLAKWKQ
ncbi:MAG: hypothetical protein M1833_004711 [Piccolia ochrophora]|nr:MAG: hypothetical protein M1833_004711 [Piccolia ochrophora]